MNSRKRKPASGSRIGMMVIAVIVTLLLVSMLVMSVGVNRKIKAYAAANEQLETEILEEMERSAEIEKLPEYIQSDEYIERVAREKFGLVYPGEIIFKAE